MILVYRSRGVMSFFDIFAYIVVISSKTVKSAKNTIFDFCEERSKKYEFCYTFAHTVVISRKNGRNQLRTRFVTLVHKTRGDMSFVKFSLIQ